MESYRRYRIKCSGVVGRNGSNGGLMHRAAALDIETAGVPAKIAETEAVFLRMMIQHAAQCVRPPSDEGQMFGSRPISSFLFEGGQVTPGVSVCPGLVPGPVPLTMTLPLPLIVTVPTDSTSDHISQSIMQTEKKLKKGWEKERQKAVLGKEHFTTDGCKEMEVNLNFDSKLPNSITRMLNKTAVEVENVENGKNYRYLLPKGDELQKSNKVGMLKAESKSVAKPLLNFDDRLELKVEVKNGLHHDSKLPHAKNELKSNSKLLPSVNVYQETVDPSQLRLEPYSLSQQHSHKNLNFKRGVGSFTPALLPDNTAINAGLHRIQKLPLSQSPVSNAKGAVTSKSSMKKVSAVDLDGVLNVLPKKYEFDVFFPAK